MIVRRRGDLLSRDQVLDELAAELTELLEAAGVVVGEFVVVQAQKAQDGDMEIADVGFAFDGGHAEFVGGADGVTGVAAATGEPEGHGVRIVVAAVSDAAALCQRLDRFVRGNKKAFSTVRIPTVDQERERAMSRRRQQLMGGPCNNFL